MSAAPSSFAQKLASFGGRPAAARAPAAAQQRVAVISEYRNFPPFIDIISGPNGQGGMRVPEACHPFVACFRQAPGRAFAVYVHERYAEVAKYLTTIKSEAAAQTITLASEPFVVTEAVLREAQKAAEMRKTSAVATSSAKYEAVEIFRSWVQAAHSCKATDLHLSIVEGGRGSVMVRIDGELETLPGTEQGLSDMQVLNAIKGSYETLADRHSNSDGTFSDSKAMSCMISTNLGIPNLRLRFASHKGFFGPKAVVRLLTTDSEKRAMSFEQMGFAKSHCELFAKAQRLDEGIVLQCGVTGSGKTTAAKAFLETHPKSGRAAIYQIADPVEYVIKHVHQIGVQRDILTLAEAGKKDSYSEVVETLMRMDPDILDLGEIRDTISARAAANVAKSGHIAIGTLHTGSIAGALSRLTDPKLGLDRAELTTGAFPYLLCYQALCPVLCDHCATDLAEAMRIHRAMDTVVDRAEADYLERLVASFRRLPVNHERLRFRNPHGCKHCLAAGRRGTVGLTIVAEMMIPDEKWFDLSAAGRDREAWKHYRSTYSDKDLTSENMAGKTVMEHAMLKAQAGLIDLRQVNRFGRLDDYEVLQ